MKNRRPAGVVFACALTVAGLALAVLASRQPAPLPVNNLALFVVLCFGVVFGQFVRIFRSDTKGPALTASLDLLMVLPLAILFSPLIAIVLVLVGKAADCIRARARLIDTFIDLGIEGGGGGFGILMVVAWIPASPGDIQLWFIVMTVILTMGALVWAFVGVANILDGYSSFREQFQIRTAAWLFVSLALTASMAALIIVLASERPAALLILAGVGAAAAGIMAWQTSSRDHLKQLGLLLSLTNALQKAQSAKEVRATIEHGIQSGFESPETAFADSPGDEMHPSVLVPGFQEQPYLVLGSRLGRYRLAELEMLEALASVATTVLRNLELRAEIETQARHDPLTGVWNRFGFWETGNAALARAERAHSMSGLCYLDLDNFKPINDLFGHQVGDEFLQAITGQIRESVRAGDIVGRLGGDEFAILLADVPNASIAEEIALQLVERIGSAVRVRGHVLECSASVGVAVAPHDGTSLDELLAAADNALYEAKHAGRRTYRRAKVA